MAFINVSGGVAGAPDYFRRGIKQGQKLTRDELDERIVLSGDLDITTEIIESVPGKGDRYLHITLSIKERDLPVETFQKIDAELKEMIFSAYPKDSFDYYSELQRPKIKHVLNKNTGELHERLDHIHILIPLVNLETGRKANPLGLVNQNLRFIDALQEHINIKYNLASPKDNKREGISTADIIARAKDGNDTFEKGEFKKVKAQLREKVGSAEIADYASFQTYLAEKGDFKIRKKGKPDEHLAFKPKGGPKFINLRDDEFLKAFFELPIVERAVRLEMASSDVVKSRMFDKRAPEDYEKILKDWNESRSKEIRYLNSGNKKLYAAYQEATPERKLEILAGLERRAQEKQEKQDGKRNRPGQDDASDRREPAARSDERGLGGPGRRQPDITPIGTEPPPAARGRLRDLPSCPLARHTAGSEIVLPDDVPGNVVELGSERLREGLRRTNAQVNPVTGRVSDSVAGQLQRDNKEAAAQRAAHTKPTIQAIIKGLDANRLLADLSVTHLLKPADYLVSPAVDGSARISHKDTPKQHYNVLDFLTKHMHMGWAEAQPYLTKAYNQQRMDIPEPNVAAPARPALWARFIGERKANWPDIEKANKQEKAEQTDTHRLENREAKNAFNKAEARVRADPSLTRDEKQDVIKLLEITKARTDGKRAERHELEVAEAARLRTRQEEYRTWLQRRAQAGEQEMLAELRAQRIEPHRMASMLDQVIAAVDNKPDAGKLLEPAAQDWQYKIARNGDVTYHSNGRKLLVDAGCKVHVVDTLEQMIEQALRLSAVKWGGKMQLAGTLEFIDKAIAIAARKNLYIEFAHQTHNIALQEAKNTIRKGREFKPKNIEKHHKLGEPEAPAQSMPAEKVQKHQVFHAPEPEQDNDLEQEQEIKAP